MSSPMSSCLSRSMPVSVAGRLGANRFQWLLVFCLLWGGTGTAGTPQVTAEALRQRFADPQSMVAAMAGLHARQTLQRFYAEREFAPAWSGGGNNDLLTGLLGAVGQAGDHGLDPADYHQAALEQAVDGGHGAEAELLATDAYLTLAAHLLGGRVNPLRLEPDWTAAGRRLDLVSHLEQALADRRIGKNLDALAPDVAAYRSLQAALKTYRQAEQAGGWQPIAAGPSLKAGESAPRVAALRRRLRATGLLSADAENPAFFDPQLEAAVATFQRRIGIEADGVVGKQTLGELNKSPAQRIGQIRANLERWRWLPADLGRRHIRVNIADFALAAYSDGKVERRHEVIVGRDYRKTPVFSDAIGYVVLNPWWDTPDRLARLDKLPDLKKDPSLVSRLGFEVLDRSGKRLDAAAIDWKAYDTGNFPFRFRQRPGPQNALGQVKLMFPNKHSVYLHDTPSRELFARGRRAFSSGCVRVADALGLTEWVLQETPGWSRGKIEAVVAGGRETRVNLVQKVAVHILYFTAEVDPDGQLRLLVDPYDRDPRLIAALDARP